MARELVIAQKVLDQITQGICSGTFYNYVLENIDMITQAIVAGHNSESIRKWIKEKIGETSGKRKIDIRRYNV